MPNANKSIQRVQIIIVFIGVMQQQNLLKKLLYCIISILIAIFCYPLITNVREKSNPAPFIVKHNYPKLRWFTTQKNDSDLKYQFSLSYFDLDQLNKTKKITHRTHRAYQIKAISKGLTCALLYDPASKIIRVFQFQLSSRFNKSMIDIKNKEIMQVAATNHTTFEIIDNCLALRIGNSSYHLDQSFTSYVQDILPLSLSTNTAFSDNYEYLVANNGIYKFNSSLNSYDLIIPTYFFKNKKIWVSGSRIVVESWEKQGWIDQNRIVYRILAFIQGSTKFNYFYLGKLEGQLFEKVPNRGPQVSISQSLDTIVVYGWEKENKLQIKGVKIDYLQRKCKIIIFPEVLKRVWSQIQVSSNYIYFRGQRQIEGKHLKQQFIFKINGSSLQRFFTRQNWQEKPDDTVQYLLHEVRQESLFLRRVYNRNGIVFVEQEQLAKKDVVLSPEPIHTETNIYISFLIVLIAVLVLLFCYNRRVKQQQNQKQIEATVLQWKQLIQMEIQSIKQYRIRGYCRALKIPTSIASDLKKLDTQKLKSAYTKLIRQFGHNKTKRIQINNAYEYLNQLYYEIEYSPIEQMLIGFIIQEQYQSLKHLLENNKQLLSFRVKGVNYQLLYFAVRGGCYQIVELVLQMGFRMDFKNDKSTPMHAAAYYGHYQIVNLLIEYGIPFNLKNSYGFLPIQQATTKEISTLLADADQDNAHKLINQLVQQKLCLTTFNIKEKGHFIAKKIILYSYTKEFSQHEDTFHGTSFQNFKSIAKHSLKKPGDIVEGKKITIVPGHSDIEGWNNAVFVSPSLLYACHPTYAKEIIKITNKKREVWLPVIQAKVKRNCYTMSGQSVNYKHKEDETKMVTYRIENKTVDDQENITVVALLLIRKEYLNSIQKYEQIKNVFLNCEQEAKYKSQLLYITQ